MSQLTTVVKAHKYNRYLFRIALDRISTPNEKEQIKCDVCNAMESLDVPPGKVAINVYKSDLPPEVDTTGDDTEINKRSKYLLCILIRSDPGGLQQDPNEIMREEIKGFTQFTGLNANQVAAVVLENAYLEVKTQSDPPSMTKVQRENWRKTLAGRGVKGWYIR